MREPLLVPVSVVVDPESLQRMTEGRPWVRVLFIMIWLVLTSLTFAFVYTSSPDFAMERACTAVLSLGLSLCVFGRFWSLNNFLPIFAFFALRGASLSILSTLLLELYSFLFSLPLTSLVLPPTAGLWPLLSTMLLVGVKEESAKLFSVLLGSSFSSASLQSVDSCCASFLPSPRRLALAGVSVGFGFMLLENVEYFIFVDLSYDASSRVVTGLARSLFNLHPYLSGLVAARLAARVYSRSGGHSHAVDWLVALWPSVLIHGFFDFLASLSTVDGLLPEDLSPVVVLGFELVLVVGTWLLVRSLFYFTLRSLPSTADQ